MYSGNKKTDFQGNSSYQFGNVSVTGSKSSAKHEAEVTSFLKKHDHIKTPARRSARRQYFAKVDAVYKSDAWKQKRKDHYDFLNKLNIEPVCMCCGAVTQLALHHLTYKRLGREKPWDLVLLCNNCHKSVHEREKDEFPRFQDRFKPNRLGEVKYSPSTRRDLTWATLLVAKNHSKKNGYIHNFYHYRDYWKHPKKYLRMASSVFGNL